MLRSVYVEIRGHRHTGPRPPRALPLESKRLKTNRFRRIAEPEDSPIGMGSMSTPIDVFFRARSVAVIGATERQASAGRAVLVNLMTKFGGAVYPVNPKRDRVLSTSERLSSEPRAANDFF